MNHRFINLTPHAINIFTPTGSFIIEPSGQIARCDETTQECGEFIFHAPAGMPVPAISKLFGEIVGLPAQLEAYDSDMSISPYVYIVSAIVAQAAWAQGRTDVVCPGDPIRDDQGRVIGCKSLCIKPY